MAQFLRLANVSSNKFILNNFGNLGKSQAYQLALAPLASSNLSGHAGAVRNRQQQQPMYHISYSIQDALFLFVGDNSVSLKKSLSTPRMIMAPTQTLDYSALVLDALHPENEIEAIPDEKHDDIMTRYAFEIEKQYHLDETKNQFVGSMGESDGGVWFVPYPSFDSLPLPVVEPLTKWELIRGT